MPDLISLPRQVLSRGHPVRTWIPPGVDPGFAGMTIIMYLIAGVIIWGLSVFMLVGAVGWVERFFIGGFRLIDEYRKASKIMKSP